jgi:hypothetical protein
MINRLKSNLITTILALGSMGVVAHAGAITTTFTFDNPAYGTLTPETGGSNQDSAIASYITNELVAAGCVGCSVTVTGAVVDTTYNGDSHVVGPNTGTTRNPVYKSVTLGDSNGATNNAVTPNSSYDNFLANTTNGSDQISQEISLVFHGLSVTNLSFDFEIFPDGTCSQLNSGQRWDSNCGGYGNPDLPDFSLTAGNGGSDTAVTAFGTGGTVFGVVPGSGDGNEKNSPDMHNETAPQYIGVSGPLTLAGDTDINFIDWPATIGVDNLSITFDPTPKVPEPSSIFLLGTVAGALLLKARRSFGVRRMK